MRPSYCLVSKLCPESRATSSLKATAPEFGCKRHSQYADVRWIVEVVIFLLQPDHGLKELASDELLVVVDNVDELGHYSRMAQVVDGLRRMGPS